MNNEIEIKKVLEQILQSEGESFQFDEPAILNELRKQEADKLGLAIKIASLFGGFLATFAFLGALWITGIYDSEAFVMLLGILFIGGAIGLNKIYHLMITDTFSVSLFIAGFALFGIGMALLNVNENIVYISLIILAICTIILVQNYLLTFISVLIINGCILAIILSGTALDIIHLYVSALAFLLTFWFLNEGKIISIPVKISYLYNPVRIGLIISFLIALIFIGKQGLFNVSPNYIWLSSVATVFCTLFIIYRICPILNILAARTKFLICCSAFLVLLPSVFSPSISGAILLILLSFLVNYKTGLGFGIISFIYFISQYYYDLDFTLLTKSILLFSSGILFLFLYLFTYKKLNHE